MSKHLVDLLFKHLSLVNVCPSLLFLYRNKRKIMRIFYLPPTVGVNPEPNFYDSLQKVRLRQQLEMYSIGEH